MEARKNILSAIQPTGDIHLGNYFGAVKNWVQLQADYNCAFGVVNYHSMTVPYKSAQLQERTWRMAFLLMACGVEAESIFLQSLIPEHTELSWILACNCSYGELQRMTQFKDKTDQLKETDKEAFISAGLYLYPVLQAADILMYHADYVPVGKDQEQHLELSRNIAQRFNHLFGKPYFKHPEPLFTELPKVLSTADPSRKMSKSLGEKHYISLLAEDARVQKQIRSAVTDTGESASNEMSAGVKNLFELLKACGNMDAHEELLADYQKGELKYVALKDAVSTAVINEITPIRERFNEINSQKKIYKQMLQESSATIRKRAQQTLYEVKEICGLPKLKLK